MKPQRRLGEEIDILQNKLETLEKFLDEEKGWTKSPERNASHAQQQSPINTASPEDHDGNNAKNLQCTRSTKTISFSEIFSAPSLRQRLSNVRHQEG